MGRPVKGLISKSKAIQTALEIVDEEGLDALSLTLVAKRLGVRAPSLYHHFNSKAELLSGVARRLLEEVEPPSPDEPCWEEMMVALCCSTRRAVLRHPAAAPLLLRFFPRNIMLPAYEFWTGRTPLPPKAKALLMEGTEKLTFGAILFAAAARSYGVDEHPEIDPGEYPVLTELARTIDDLDEEQVFAESLRALIEGIKRRHGMMETQDAAAG